MVNDQLEQVHKALNDVIDPHMGVSIVDMGMVKRVEATLDDEVYVGIVNPCVGCPALEIILADIRKEVGKLDGVIKVKARVEWGHQWDKEDISCEGRARAARHGYVI
ncbi:DUF59 domain-containing protein [Thalassotalea sp. HSM 43]|uniref:metal-sulfur cluster assembly factor n=1 Tax=Thalassotalea sp. HSM 43 TaxID=2552945 RepID=UPI001080E314|nr:iron-sulfur cluster assembly protein [Thalassotalea sp. HSM 43]QBY03322.1 DUF59 domain-containing protein [Thalassotalea sp. HSM 43]